MHWLLRKVLGIRAMPPIIQREFAYYLDDYELSSDSEAQSIYRGLVDLVFNDDLDEDKIAEARQRLNNIRMR